PVLPLRQHGVFSALGAGACAEPGEHARHWRTRGTAAGAARGATVAGGSATLSLRWQYRWRAFCRVHRQARSLLAVACLAVGIVTLLLVLALEAGARAQIAAILADTGTRTLTINPGEFALLPNRGSGVALATTLTLADYELLATSALPAARIAAVSSGARAIEYRELAVAASVTGTQPEYFALRRFEAALGRVLDAADLAASARVAVLGARVAEQLFGRDQEAVLTPEAALGRTILIGRMPFEVVGVLAARGSGQTGLSQDDGVYVPLSTALRRVFNVDYLNSIFVEALDVADLEIGRASCRVTGEREEG